MLLLYICTWEGGFQCQISTYLCFSLFICSAKKQMWPLLLKAHYVNLCALLKICLIQYANAVYKLHCNQHITLLIKGYSNHWQLINISGNWMQ